MKEEASQVRRLRKHPIHRCAVPLPQWGRQRGGGFAPQKEANPASLRPLPLPREGARVDTPSFLWKEVPPKGRRLDGGSGMKESEEMHLKSTINESTLSTAGAVPLSRVGKVASGASRIGFWRDERE